MVRSQVKLFINNSEILDCFLSQALKRIPVSKQTFITWLYFLMLQTTPAFKLTKGCLVEAIPKVIEYFADTHRTMNRGILRH